VLTANNRTQTSGSLPSLEKPTCPDAHNRNYTSTVSAPEKKYRLQCYVNYGGGDGQLGLQNGTIESMPACLDACAREKSCVGAVFKQRTPTECWLKEYLGLAQGGQAEWTMSAVLWQ